MSPEEAIQQHSRLVYKIAARFYRFINGVSAIDPDDLVQCGFIGLIKGAKRFDENQGFRPSTYLSAMIQGEIMRHLRDNLSSVRVPRDTKFRDRRHVVSKSLNQPVVEDDKQIEFVEVLPSYDDQTVVEVRDLIDRTLTDRRKKILSLRMSGMIQKDIGKQIGFSQVEVSRELVKIRKQLQEAMHA